MSIGRPLAFDPDAALQAAMEVFWSKGYEAASLQDLLQAMTLSKSSLYQTFGSKQELFARCFVRYCDWRASRMRARLAQCGSGWAFIEETFAQVAEGADRGLEGRGCLLMNTASEFGQRDPLVAELVAAGVARFAEVFREAVGRAQREGAIPAERDAQALAEYLVTSMSGLRTMVKAGMSSAHAHDVVRSILRGLV
jgi:TetR/AcrR family transcriptional repressor of nem operon